MKKNIVKFAARRHFRFVVRGWCSAATCFFLFFQIAGCQRLPTQPAASALMTMRGITFADWTPSGYQSAPAESALQAIAATGANHLALIVTAYQAHHTSNQVFSDSTRTPSFSAVQHALQRAASLGFKLSLKPHVDLQDGAWRGTISPAQPGLWFESYNSFLYTWTALAESAGVDQFIIGTELAGTLQYREHWLETIRRVKAAFSGKLVYAASWDEADKVPFWRELDFVGVDFYFPVTARKNPGRFEILAGWQPWLERLFLLHRQTGRQIILTEIGYRSIDGAGMQPYVFGNEAVPDLAEQADLYWAALQATSEASWLAGMFWWNWPADGSGGLDNTDYTPAGKPAEKELADSWSR